MIEILRQKNGKSPIAKRITLLASPVFAAKNIRLYYLFTIENTVKGNTLFSSKSSCIKNLVATTWMMRLQFKKGCLSCTIQLKTTSSFSFRQSFSRKLLEKLYEEGTFDCDVVSLFPELVHHQLS